MADTAAADTSAGTGVFSRKASGLVRVGSTLDVFIFNVGLVSVGIAIAYNQYYGPSLYPGRPAVDLDAAGRGRDDLRRGCLLLLVGGLPAVGRGLRLPVPDDQPGRRLRHVADRDDHPALLRGAGGRADRAGRRLVLLRRGRHRRPELHPGQLGPDGRRAEGRVLDRDADHRAGRRPARLWDPALLHRPAGALRDRRRRAGRDRDRDAGRQPGRLQSQPDQPDRAAREPGHRGGPQARLRRGRHELRRELEVHHLAAAAAARRRPVGRHRRRGEEGAPVAAVRHARRGRRHRARDRAVRAAVEQGLRLHVPGRGRVQRPQRRRGRPRPPRRGSPCWPGSSGTTSSCPA